MNSDPSSSKVLVSRLSLDPVYTVSDMDLDCFPLLIISQPKGR